MNYDTKAVREIALRIFGSEDYEAILDILPPYDGMVKSFMKEIRRLEQGGIYEFK